jgi:uncharacterized protein (TIGR03437 family)
VKSAAQAALSGGSDIYVTKLDPSGNVIYATYFGGRADDTASAMAVDAVGNVYVTGQTSSPDFPTTKGAFQPTPPQTAPLNPAAWTFLVKFNSDGAVAWSTYFTTSLTTPSAIAADGAGSTYITGFTKGDLPVTPGAYQSVCNCGVQPGGFLSIPHLSIIYVDGFAARFDAAGSKLTYATYLGVANSIGMTIGTALAVATDGSAYVGASTGIYRLDAAGSTLLAHGLPKIMPQAMALRSDGSLYITGLSQGQIGAPGTFLPTPGAAQTNPNLAPKLEYQPQLNGQQAIVRMDAQLQTTIAATYFGGPYNMTVSSLALDASGNVYVGGSTSPRGLPTVTPFVEAFGSSGTGFATKLSADLSSVQFSSYFGDAEYFDLRSVAVGAGGSLILGGATIQTGSSAPLPGAVWVNSLALTPPPALRIDSVANAASRLGDPISSGETIAVTGAGFGPDTQLLIGGVPVQTIAVTPTQITAVAPEKLPDGAVTVQVQSGGALSNAVLTPVAAASPGLFSVDRTGLGQGYILNQDGTRNTPDKPAKPGDRITIYATGVGPVNFDHGYAVTANPVSVYVDIFYALGVAAVMGPVDGFPGDVYQLTVYVPDRAQLVAINPDLKNFQYPPQVGVILKIAGGSSQNGLAISIAQ